jgi:hypothetical protein
MHRGGRGGDEYGRRRGRGCAGGCRLSVGGEWAGGESLGGGHVFVEAGCEGREVEGGDMCEKGCIFRV